MGIIGWQHSDVHYHDPSSLKSARYKRNSYSDEQDEGTSKSSDFAFHPFENACKYAIPNIYAPDIMRISERLRQLQCPYEDFDLATMDSEGYMYIHPHYAKYPKYLKDVNCKVIFLEGALRDNITNKGKNVFKEVAEVEVNENKRFFANGDAFYIRCFNNGTKIFEDVYPGMRDLDRVPNTVYYTRDTQSFDDYGRKLASEPLKKRDSHYSIDILAFDSTSRTMFMRHLPRTLETMNKLGYELFYGYNKIGDNSEVNLVSLLAGDLPEALEEPKLDESGDININWILPLKRRLDPTNIPFLWKMMGKEFGCRSMLNEDISVDWLGLFHYPSDQFLPGFTSPPADHFYRTYYLAVYKARAILDLLSPLDPLHPLHYWSVTELTNDEADQANQDWKYSQCKDGGQVQRRYVDLWRRFANKYKDVCHMGFTFVTTLSHEDGFTLEVLDEQISSSLENLYFTGALDKGVSIIMGDHGNRIGIQQYSYTGRIEERMPLMAIRMPSEFKKLHPKEYSNFMINKWKLTSNFDIHQTLKDVALMNFGSARRLITRSYGRGISLFDEISANRSCFDAYIPENFCTCLIDRSNLTSAAIEAAKLEEILFAVKVFLENSGIVDCFNLSNTTIVDNATIFGLNPLARHGIRRKDNATRVEEARNKPSKMDFLYHEVVVLAETSANRGSVSLLFRIEEAAKEESFRVVLEPLVQNAPADCYYKSVFSVCKCLFSLNGTVGSL